MSNLNLRKKLTKLYPMSTQKGAKRNSKLSKLKFIRNAAQALFFTAKKKSGRLERVKRKIQTLFVIA
jgi:hypothetical protein